MFEELKQTGDCQCKRPIGPIEDGKEKRANRTNSPMRGHCKNMHHLGEIPFMANFSNSFEFAYILTNSQMAIHFLMLMYAPKVAKLKLFFYFKTYSISIPMAQKAAIIQISNRFSSVCFKFEIIHLNIIMCYKGSSQIGSISNQFVHIKYISV
jgi:hypothetical protein